MTPIAHGSFNIDRTFNAPVARVFAAWSEIDTKARWFIGPPERWRLSHRELDFRVGGREELKGELAGGPTTHFVARYHAIEAQRRLVYDYDMYVGSKHLSVSLASVEFRPTESGGTRMTFTEQAAFLDGEDGTLSRQTGTAAHFDRLSVVLSDPCDVVSARLFDAPRARVFQAFSDPTQLVTWWGPQGFSNEFQAFDLRPGGAWRFVMRGPDGARYEMDKQFLEVVPQESVVLRHFQTQHEFRMYLGFREFGEQTLLTWRLHFESEEEAVAVREHVAKANEQNFDRLAAHLRSSAV